MSSPPASGRARHNCFPVSLRSPEARRAYLAALGVCPEGADRILARMDALCLQVENLDPRGAAILKQDLLSLGGDLAVPESVSRFQMHPVRGLLMGTRRHLTYLIQGLRDQPYGLRTLAAELRECLERMDRRRSLRVRGSDLLEGRRFLVMGILNVTPDSFSDGGRFLAPADAVAQGVRMAEEGAHLLDVGAESSRPGSDPVGADEEIRRLLPVLKGLRRSLPELPVSVDTVRSEVARAALEEGADLINDISAGLCDPAMLPLAAARGAPIVLMHLRGTPRTMQEDPSYEDPVGEVIGELRGRVEAAEDAGLGVGQLVVDPGIGFGKRPGDNLALLDQAGSLRSLGHPVLVGASRKSLVGHLTGAPVGERLPGSIALHVGALLRGASVFRVHDVREHVQALTVAAELAG